MTFRVDPTWGVSNNSRTLRKDSKYLRRSAGKSPSSSYERCKATQRCARGWNQYFQSSSESKSTMQSFAGGEHTKIALFADFEDWRQGTRGWKQSCDFRRSSDKCFPQASNESHLLKPRGAHWSPFLFNSLGPNIPSFNSSSNNGLVLNEVKLEFEIEQQLQLIEDIENYIKWIKNEMNITSLDAKTQFRIDIKNNLIRTQHDYQSLLTREKRKLDKLSNSQCRNEKCSLLFNTSNLELTGAINATGIIAKTPDGTEVATWSFDSIDIGNEVNVTLTGQRPMALLSKSSVQINTTMRVHPGTLGGFPGGFSVFRKKKDRINSVCNEESHENVRKDDYSILSSFCPGDSPLSELEMETKSNNINGPGSSSVRVYLHT